VQVHQVARVERIAADGAERVAGGDDLAERDGERRGACSRSSSPSAWRMVTVPPRGVRRAWVTRPAPMASAGTLSGMK
jgi:hypothetical protein